MDFVNFVKDGQTINMHCPLRGKRVFDGLVVAETADRVFLKE